jgi:hypothetical protein
MVQLRQSIYATRSHADAFSELTRLDKLFLSAYKRAAKVELFFSSEGSERENQRYGITAYYLPEQKDELDFFVKNAKASTV